MSRTCLCGSMRFMSVSAKCSDLCTVNLDGKDHDGYVPDGLNIGGADYVQFNVCVQCGRIMGNWPLPPMALDLNNDDEEYDIDSDDDIDPKIFEELAPRLGDFAPINDNIIDWNMAELIWLHLRQDPSPQPNPPLSNLDQHHQQPTTPILSGLEVNTTVPIPPIVTVAPTIPRAPATPITMLIPETMP